MALSVSQAWIDAVSKSGVELRILANVYRNSGVADSFIDGKVDGSSLPESIADLSHITRSIDIVTGKPRISTAVLEFVWDGAVQTMVLDNPLRDTMVYVYVGTKELATAQWARLYAGRVADIEVEWGVGLRLVLKDPASRFFRLPVVFSSVNEHPLDVAEALYAKGVVSGLLDAASFSPSSYTDISHHVCDVGSQPLWGGDRRIRKSTPLENLTAKARVMLSGDVVTHEDGKVAFVEYDKAASAIRTWSIHDIVGNVRPLEMYGQIINKVVTVSNQMDDIQEFDEPFTFEHVEADLDSIADFGVNGEAFTGDAESMERIVLDWVWNSSVLVTTMTASTPSAISVIGIHSNCGSRWPGYPAGSQPTDATLTASRTAYLYIEGEIVEVQALTMGGVRELAGATVPTWGTYTVKTRGVLGTTAAAHDIGSDVFDVTIAVFVAQQRIERFKRGSLRIAVDTLIRQHDIQLGDVVSINDDSFISHNIDGLTAAYTWTVVSKRMNRDRGLMEWELVLHDDAIAVNWDTPAPNLIERDNIAHDMRRHLIDEGVGRTAVESGLGLTVGAGLSVTVETGKAGNHLSTTTAEAITRDVEASRDTYIFFDARSRAIDFWDVATGAGQPTVATGMILLHEVIAGASAVTTVDDLRNSEAIHGTRLIKDTVSTGKLIVENDLGKSLALNHQFGDFSNGTTKLPDNWNLSGSGAKYGAGLAFETETTLTQSGFYAIKVNGNQTSAGSRKMVGDFVPVITGTPWKLSARLRQSAIAAGDDWTAVVQGYQADKSTTTETFACISGKSLNAANTWETRTTTGRFTDANTRYVRLELTFKTSGSAVGYCDYFELSRAPVIMRAKRSAGGGQNVLTAATDIVEYSNDEDPQSVWDAATYKFTAPYDMWAIAVASVDLHPAGASSGKTGLGIYVNGSIHDQSFLEFPDANDRSIAVVTMHLYLAEGDTVDARLINASGVTMTINQSDDTTYFELIEVGH